MTNEIAQETPSPPPEPRKPWWTPKKWAAKIPIDLIPLIVLVLVVFLVILYANDWKYWDGQWGSETTNDAYVRADVTPLSTKVSGTVAKVFINDFDTVKKGDLIAELRDDDFKARVNEAQALHQQALSNIAVVSGQTLVQEQRIENAKFTVSVGQQDVSRTTASIGSNRAALAAAQARLEEAKSEKVLAEAKVAADAAVELRASQERSRQQLLFTERASTPQTIEQVVANHVQAQQNTAADRANVTRLDHAIKERAADIIRFQEELKSADAQNSGSVFGMKSQQAQMSAETKQLDVLKDQLKDAQANAAAKLASLKDAQVALDYTKIRAPVDGVLSDRRVRAGQQVNAGTQVVTIVSSLPWVIASFRETQLRKMTVGNKAEISVDALGGASLKGRVQSIAPGSEAQFALLPADNPSGNFTKITQRLQVKIVLDSDQQKLSRIRPGMTVIAKVFTDTK
jgi:membrane fusion protein (multidrug efflux system)